MEKRQPVETLNSDLLIVGGGAAGSRAAYEAKKAQPRLNVKLVVAGRYGSTGSTNLVASESLGINAPFNCMGDGDDPEVYTRDMLETGAGLSDPSLCRIIAGEACERVSELMALGLKFDSEDLRPIQRKLSGCTRARSLTCGGSTGREIVRVLKKALLRSGVEVLEGTRVLQLVQDEEGRVRGALGIARGKPVFIKVNALVLANGGAGKIFRHSVNPPSLEGDGWCMAYHAGARLVNMEFFQVGPAVFRPRIMFIIHSHMWRLGPRLTNVLGEEFLARYCPPGVDPHEVMFLKAMSYPFSVRSAAMYLDLAIFKEVMAGRGTPSGGVSFDVRHVDRKMLLERAPITYKMLKRAGVDLAEEPIEIGMVVQNFNGGILIDENGFTGVQGLFAAGEVTGGVHGADRPGGNNLIDTQVFGYRAGRAAAQEASQTRVEPMKKVLPKPFETRPLSSKEKEIVTRSAEAYTRNLTIVRTKKGLQEILQFVGENRGHHLPQVENRLTLGEILATAALTREESRGTHYREDFPRTDPAWTKRIIISKGPGGAPNVEITPMPITP
jgi:fumarate reductase (CoM/CoB) subunit A